MVDVTTIYSTPQLQKANLLVSSSPSKAANISMMLYLPEPAAVVPKIHSRVCAGSRQQNCKQ
jgi:hypothetical protein